MNMTVPRTICFGFLAVITTGTFLLMLPISNQDGTWDHFLTALFTSTSAVCVTGLSVIDVGTYYSFWGQLFLVILIQVGGLGYMSATTVLLIILGRKFSLKDKIALQQSLDKAGMAGVVQLVKSIIAMTALIELTGIVLLMFVFVPRYGWLTGLWTSIFHSISAFNNAGFSLYPDSLMSYAHVPLLNLVITLLIITGGLGYKVMMEIYLWLRDRFSKDTTCVVFSLHFKIVTGATILLVILGTLFFLVTEINNPETLGSFSWSQRFLAAWFQSVTTRTAGFNTINTGSMTTSGLFLTIAFMFIGASPGSTGGGIKTTTSRVLLSTAKAALEGRDSVICYQREIGTPLIVKAVGVVVGSGLVVIVSTTLMAQSDPQIELVKIFFEAVSAFATVGLSTGVTASFSIVSKLVLIVTMYIGRVGVLLLMAAILGESKPSIVNYPEEHLLIG